MDRQDTYNCDSIELSIDFSTAITEEIPTAPDAFEIRMKREKERGEDREIYYSYASLEQLFLVLELIEIGRSGIVNFGTSEIGVKIDNQSITVDRQFNIYGDPEEIRGEIESLIQQVFAELQRREVNPLEAIDEIATGRFAPWDIDLIEIQRQLIDSA